MIKVYKGSSSSYSDMICNVNQDRVYKKSSSSYSDVLCGDVKIIEK